MSDNIPAGQAPKEFKYMASTPNGKFIAYIDGQEVNVFDSESRQIIGTSKKFDGKLLNVRINNTGNRIAVFNGKPIIDKYGPSLDKYKGVIVVWSDWIRDYSEEIPLNNFDILYDNFTFNCQSDIVVLNNNFLKTFDTDYPDPLVKTVELDETNFGGCREFICVLPGNFIGLTWEHGLFTRIIGNKYYYDKGITYSKNLNISGDMIVLSSDEPHQSDEYSKKCLVIMKKDKKTKYVYGFNEITSISVFEDIILCGTAKGQVILYDINKEKIIHTIQLQPGNINGLKGFKDKVVVLHENHGLSVVDFVILPPAEETHCTPAEPIVAKRHTTELCIGGKRIKISGDFDLEVTNQ